MERGTSSLKKLYDHGIDSWKARIAQIKAENPKETEIMSKIEVDAIEPQSGTSLTLGASGDTITIPSGATLTNSGTATGLW
jgi:hypothetical protein